MFKRWILAGLTVLPSIIIAVISWAVSLFYLLYKIPYSNYCDVMYGKPKQKTMPIVNLTKEEYEKIIEERNKKQS